MTVDVVGKALDVALLRIHPNPWNPNVMDEAMFQKELASIRAYGFAVPLVVRWRETVDTTTVGENLEGKTSELPVDYEIIDGEHRWRAAAELGMKKVPVWDLGQIDDDTAREMTIVLNETRGQSDRTRLAELLQDLLKRRDERILREVMPFDRERFNELVSRKEVDWSSLDEKRQALQERNEQRWVERVYRLPAEAAETVDSAIAQVMESEDVPDWRALELIAADFISGS